MPISKIATMTGVVTLVLGLFGAVAGAIALFVQQARLHKTIDP